MDCKGASSRIPLYMDGKLDAEELEPFIKPNRTRYAHKRCADKREAEKTQEERDKEALEKYIIKLLDEPYLSARVKKQIKDYIEAIVEAVLPTYLTDDVTPSEMNKAIEGMYEACYQEAERIK